MCRLHNFLVEVRIRENAAASTPAGRRSDETAPPSLAADGVEITANGGVPLVPRGANDSAPEQLMDGGHHFDDTAEAFRRQIMRRGMGDAQLPRERLREVVRFGGHMRPLPPSWQAF